MKKEAMLIAAIASAAIASAAKVERIFLPERYTKGDVNVRVVQSIDGAAWIWHPTADGDEAFNREFHQDITRSQFNTGWRGQRFMRFRKSFEQAGAPLEFSVSADERFVLLLDGEVIARGPNRGTLDSWAYQTYRAELAPGRHSLEAVVWQIGPFAPNAQLSWRGGFVLKAEGPYDKLLTTGKAEWQVAPLKNTRMRNPAFGVGAQCEVSGTSLLDETPAESEFARAVIIRRSQANNEYGLQTPGWLLAPSALPDQLEARCVPGAIKAVRSSVDGGAAYAEADASAPLAAAFSALLNDGKAVTVPAHSTVAALWDLGDYYCAYPDLSVKGGKGARIEWRWAESLWGADGKKGSRDAFIGKKFNGNSDSFMPDGRGDGHFTTPWWRCGRWCEIAIAAGDEPVELTKIYIIETRYPTPPTGSFECDDPTLAGVQKICVRGMQMCMHEMFFDCPFYEQQMYPGDTRVQLLTVGALNSDDRLIRRAIELYDFSRRTDGTVGFNFPTYGTQDGTTYTLIWAFMFRDYMMWHDNAKWLRARMPGLRMMLHGAALYENADGLLENLPGWSFMDWVPGWGNGVAPDGSVGQGGSSLNNLLYIYALQSASEVEAALGEPLLAAHWKARADAVARKVVEKFWSPERGMLADTARKDRFSEHAQCLALLAGILSPEQERQSFKGLLEAKDLARTTVYFSHYLFDAYARFGRTDLLLKRLDLWRDYVKLGLRTPLESPGDSARSDCHAWGAHPLLHLQRDVAGVSPAEPFFKSVRVAPCPGGLKRIVSATPHPKGWVRTSLSFEGDSVRGTVTLPAGAPGSFIWRGGKTPLVPGANKIEIGNAR